MIALAVLGPHLQGIPIRKEIPAELSIGTARTLMEVSLGDGQLTVGDLAVRMRLPLPRTSKLLGELEGLNLIERTRDSEDRRRVTVRMSRTGRSAARALHRAHRARLASLIDVMGREDTEKLLDVLERAADRLRTSVGEKV